MPSACSSGNVLFKPLNIKVYTLLISSSCFYILVKCYGLSVISVTVPKGGYSGNGGLYKTSGTIR